MMVTVSEGEELGQMGQTIEPGPVARHRADLCRPPRRHHLLLWHNNRKRHHAMHEGVARLHLNALQGLLAGRLKAGVELCNTLDIEFFISLCCVTIITILIATLLLLRIQ